MRLLKDKNNIHRIFPQWTGRWTGRRPILHVLQCGSCRSAVNQPLAFGGFPCQIVSKQAMSDNSVVNRRRKLFVRKNYPPLPPRRPGKKASCLLKTFGWLVALVALAALVTEAVVLTILLSERGYAGYLYPNIHVQGLEIGNRPLPTARTDLEQHYASFLLNPATLTYGEKTWNPTAEDLGLTVDFTAALQLAAPIGRTAARVDNARTVAAVWQWGVQIPLQVKVDQPKLQQYLLRLASEIEVAPQNAEVALVGANVVLTPEEWGTQALVDETLADLTAALQTLQPQQVSFRTRALAPVFRDSDAQQIVAQVEVPLNGSIFLNSPIKQWEWPRSRLAQWVKLNRVDPPSNYPQYSLTFDQDGIRQALEPLEKSFRQEGRLPRLNWQNGNLFIFEQGGTGKGLDGNLALTKINEALQGGSRTIELALTPLPPPITAADLPSLGINRLLATGVSSFSKSEAYRITNIVAGANRVHGVLIPPGDLFSFNASLGAVDASNGFVPGYAIINNRTQKEWGGGLCQVSTTLFRAAFMAGLPITERHEHQFRISWYEELGEPPGYDAAIFTGASDLQFVNDTGGWLLTQAWADLKQQRLYLALYGAKAPRQVTMSHRITSQTPAPSKPVTIQDPTLPAGTYKQSDWARPGLTTIIYRTVKENGLLLRQDSFPTTFKPWPNIFVRGTGR